MLVRSNGSALDSDLALLDGIGSIDSHLIVGGVSVLHAQVEVLDIEVKIWVDVLKSKSSV